MLVIIIVLEPYAINPAIATRQPIVTAFSYVGPWFISSKITLKPLNPWTEIKINNNFKYEKLFRKDNYYDYFIVINYNSNKGSAIFIHLTNNYKKTAGCIALKKKDLLIVCKLISKKTKIKIF